MMPRCQSQTQTKPREGPSSSKPFRLPFVLIVSLFKNCYVLLTRFLNVMLLSPMDDEIFQGDSNGLN